MKSQIALSLAFASLMTASAAFAAPAVLNNGPRATHQNEHQLQQKSGEAHIAANGSERTIDRLHKQMGDEARVAANGSERTIDRLHQEMDQVRVAENGTEHSIDRLHGRLVAESGGDTVFDAHLKA